MFTGKVTETPTHHSIVYSASNYYENWDRRPITPLTYEIYRHVREHLSEEELTVFDILTRPGPDLAPEEREEVKKVAKQLLTKLRSLLVLNWRQKAQARAQVRLAIEDALEDGLPQSGRGV